MPTGEPFEWTAPSLRQMRRKLSDAEYGPLIVKLFVHQTLVQFSSTKRKDFASVLQVVNDELFKHLQKAEQDTLALGPIATAALQEVCGCLHAQGRSRIKL